MANAMSEHGIGPGLPKGNVDPRRPGAAYAFDPKVTVSSLMSEALAPLAAMVESKPDTIAVDDGRTTLTNRQLWLAVQSLAIELKQKLPDEGLVLLLARSDVYLSIMLLGTHLAGFPAVVLDLSSPPERQAVIAAEVNARAIVVPENEERDVSFAPDAVHVIARLRPQAPTAFMRREILPDEIFFVGFTSGSTGRPKGIVISTWSVLNFIAQDIKFLQLGPADVVLALGPPSAFGARDALICALSGARLRIMNLKEAGVSEALRVLQADRVTVMNAVPSLMRALVRVPGIEESLATLRILSLGGEPLTRADLKLLRSVLPVDCKIGFSFGSTEVLQIFSWIVDDAAVQGETVPLGAIAEGRKIRLLDENGRSITAGQTGELVVCDRHVAVGDWSGGGIDQSRFPLDADSGTRRFSTGDLVRWREDGHYEFAGRVDRMVKLNGLRVDLESIEGIVRSLTGIKDAAVVSYKTERDEPRLTLFVVTEAGVEVSDSLIRRQVAAQVSTPVPFSAILRIDDIPRLHNLKPDFVSLGRMVTA